MMSRDTNDDHRYAELASRAEWGELHGIPGTQLHGEGAAAAARGLLFTATGTRTVDEAARVALGRPRVGEADRPETTTWRVRTPAPLDERAREAAAAEGVSLSEYIRRAVDRQISADRAASG